MKQTFKKPSYYLLSQAMDGDEKAIELIRIENEIARLDSMVLNAWHHKKRNWCQIGVKTEKITISKEIRYCKPLILKGLQKKSQKISTHLMTVLIIGVFVQLEQEGRA